MFINSIGWEYLGPNLWPVQSHKMSNRRRDLLLVEQSSGSHIVFSNQLFHSVFTKCYLWAFVSLRSDEEKHIYHVFTLKLTGDFVSAHFCLWVSLEVCCYQPLVNWSRLRINDPCWLIVLSYFCIMIHSFCQCHKKVGNIASRTKISACQCCLSGLLLQSLSMIINCQHYLMSI